MKLSELSDFGNKLLEAFFYSTMCVDEFPKDSFVILFKNLPKSILQFIYGRGTRNRHMYMIFASFDTSSMHGSLASYHNFNVINHCCSSNKLFSFGFYLAADL